MAIRVNNVEIPLSFNGVIQLGNIEKLYTSSTDTNQYTLYGTVYRQDPAYSLSVPSGAYSFTPGSQLTQYFINRASDRLSLCQEIDRLEELKSDLSNGKYNYGINDTVVETISSLLVNQVKPLPAVILGGKLSYQDLYKTNAEAAPFEDEWVSTAKLTQGFKRYTVPPEEQPEFSVDIREANVGAGASVCHVRGTDYESVYGDFVFVPGLGATGGSLYSVVDSQASWVMDIGSQYQIVKSTISTYYYSNNTYVIILAACSDKARVFTVILDQINTGSPVVSTDEFLREFDINSLGYNANTLSRLEIRFNSGNVFFGMYRERPGVSNEVDLLQATCAITAFADLDASSDQITINKDHFNGSTYLYSGELFLTCMTIEDETGSWFYPVVVTDRCVYRLSAPSILMPISSGETLYPAYVSLQNTDSRDNPYQPSGSYYTYSGSEESVVVTGTQITNPTGVGAPVPDEDSPVYLRRPGKYSVGRYYVKDKETTYFTVSETLGGDTVDFTAWGASLRVVPSVTEISIPTFSTYNEVVNVSGANIDYPSTIPASVPAPVVGSRISLKKLPLISNYDPITYYVKTADVTTGKITVAATPDVDVAVAVDFTTWGATLLVEYSINEYVVNPAYDQNNPASTVVEESDIFGNGITRAHTISGGVMLETYASSINGEIFSDPVPHYTFSTFNFASSPTSEVLIGSLKLPESLLKIPGLPSVCGSSGSEVFVRLGNTVHRVGKSGITATIDASHIIDFGRNYQADMKALIGGGLVKLVDDTLFTYPSLEQANTAQVIVNDEGYSGYSNIHYKTDVIADEEALAKSHPILDSTIYDAPVSRVGEDFTIPNGYSGSYSSKLLDSVFYSTGNTVDFWSTSGGMFRKTKTLQLDGSIVMGCDADIGDSFLTVLYMTDGAIPKKLVSILTNKVTGQASVVQQLTLSVSLLPGMGTANTTTAPIIVFINSSGVVSLSSLCRYGLVIPDTGIATVTTVTDPVSMFVGTKFSGDTTLAIHTNTGGAYKIRWYTVYPSGSISTVTKIASVSTTGIIHLFQYASADYVLVRASNTLCTYKVSKNGQLLIKYTLPINPRGITEVLPYCVAYYYTGGLNIYRLTENLVLACTLPVTIPASIAPVFSAVITVSSTTPGALIRYTIDGSDPTEDSLYVFSGDTVTVPIPGVLKTLAWHPLRGYSEIATFTYE